jgi:type III secretion system FlhB-like substrate exporter
MLIILNYQCNPKGETGKKNISLKKVTSLRQMAIAERRKYSLMLAKFSLAREIPPAIYQLIAPSYWEQKKLYL